MAESKPEISDNDDDNNNNNENNEYNADILVWRFENALEIATDKLNDNNLIMQNKLESTFTDALQTITRELSKLNLKNEQLETLINNISIMENNEKNNNPTPNFRRQSTFSYPPPNFGAGNTALPPKTPFTASKRQSTFDGLFNNNSYNNKSNQVQVMFSRQSYDKITLGDLPLTATKVRIFLFDIKLFLHKNPQEKSTFPAFATFASMPVLSRIVNKSGDPDLDEISILSTTDKMFTELLIKAITPSNIMEFRKSFSEAVTFPKVPALDKYSAKIQYFEILYQPLRTYIREWIDTFDILTKFIKPDSIPVCNNKDHNKSPGLIKMFLDPIPDHYGQNIFTQHKNLSAVSFTDIRDFIEVFEEVINTDYQLYQSVVARNYLFQSSPDNKIKNNSNDSSSKTNNNNNNYSNKYHQNKSNYNSFNKNNYSRNNNNNLSSIADDQEEVLDFPPPEDPDLYNDYGIDDSELYFQRFVDNNIEDLNAVHTSYRNSVTPENKSSTTPKTIDDWKNSTDTKGCMHKILYKECNKHNCPFNHKNPEVLSKTCHMLIKSLADSEYNNMYSLVSKVNPVKKDISTLRFNNIINSDNNSARSILKYNTDANKESNPDIHSDN
jgi:hypothetical protein